MERAIRPVSQLAAGQPPSGWHLRTEFFLLAGLAMAVPVAWWAAVTAAGGAFAFNDFHDYWLTAKIVGAGGSAYDLDALRALAKAEDLEFVVGTGYSYPPPFAILMVPFTALPFTSAVLLFNALSLVVFGATVAAWIGWAHRSDEAGLRRRMLLALAAGGYAPIFGTLANGQANLLVLAPLAIGAVLTLEGRRPGRGFRGGVAIGLAAIVKLIPALLLVPLALARRGAAIGGIVAGSLGSLLVAAVLAPHAGAGAERLGSLFAPDPYFTNQSINGFVTRLVQPTSRTVAIWPRAFDPHLPVLVLTGAFALVTALILWRARARLAERRGLALGIALALVAGLIGAPKTSFWTQALAILGVGLALAVVASDLHLGGLGRTDLGLLACWYGGAAIQAALWAFPPTTTVVLAPIVTILTSASLVGMVGLWCMLARRLVNDQPYHHLPTHGRMAV